MSQSLAALFMAATAVHSLSLNKPTNTLGGDKTILKHCSSFLTCESLANHWVNCTFSKEIQKNQACLIRFSNRCKVWYDNCHLFFPYIKSCLEVKLD